MDEGGGPIRTPDSNSKSKVTFTKKKEGPYYEDHVKVELYLFFCNFYFSPCQPRSVLN